MKGPPAPTTVEQLAKMIDKALNGDPVTGRIHRRRNGFFLMTYPLGRPGANVKFVSNTQLADVKKALALVQSTVHLPDSDRVH